MKLTVKSVAAIVAAISISAYGIAVYNTPQNHFYSHRGNNIPQ